mmetsp:Transcript_17096/g.39886  ORF Transcript_17096/g.39886 Transcript_17096/m.39886 type:complete len:247 (+) Transcript_17096:80-820(+)
MPQAKAGNMKAADSKVATKHTSPVFHKTKMCRFHLLGSCNRGDTCVFAHQKEDLMPMPDFTCTRLCERLIAHGCCEVHGCKFAHNREELRTRKAKAKSQTALLLGADKVKQTLCVAADDSLELDGPWSRQSTGELARCFEHDTKKMLFDEADDSLELDGPWSRQSTEDEVLETGPFRRVTTTDSEWQGFCAQAPTQQSSTPAVVFSQPVGAVGGISYSLRNSFLHFGPPAEHSRKRAASASSANIL